MAIYDYNANTVAEQLTPPVLRNTKLLAWLYVLVKPLQEKWYNIFQDYKLGNVYTDYSNATTYNLFDKVRWEDKAIYECIATTSLANLPSDTDNWVKINDIFIGVDERVKYTAQKLLFEQALNTFFITTGIYIENNFINASTNFVMGSASSSVMPLNSVYQIDYMGLTPYYSANTNDYTIFVPVAYHTSLGVNADLIISTYADKYNLVGMNYNIMTY